MEAAVALVQVLHNLVVVVDYDCYFDPIFYLHT
jgi:hypothetical protein